MSLLSTEALHVFLTPSALWALTRCGWRGRLGWTRRLDAVPDVHKPWEGILAALEGLLLESKAANLRVVLSHYFVQYSVLPWREDVVGETEYEALAQVGFSAAFGNMADGWSIGLSDEPPGRPRIAAAVPAPLLDGLRSVAKASGTVLRSVKPFLCVDSITRLLRIQFPGWSWLLLHEPGRIGVLVRQQDRWFWVRHIRVGGDWVQNLSVQLASEALLAGLEVIPADVVVFAPGAGPDAWATLREAGFRVLEPVTELEFQGLRDGPYAPAWLA